MLSLFIGLERCRDGWRTEIRMIRVTVDALTSWFVVVVDVRIHVIEHSLMFAAIHLIVQHSIRSNWGWLISLKLCLSRVKVSSSLEYPFGAFTDPLDFDLYHIDKTLLQILPVISGHASSFKLDTFFLKCDRCWSTSIYYSSFVNSFSVSKSPWPMGISVSGVD